MLRLRYYSFRARNTGVAYNFDLDIDCQREYVARMIITVNCNNVAKERLGDFDVNVCGLKEKKNTDKNGVANCKSVITSQKYSSSIYVCELSRFTKRSMNS